MRQEFEREQAEFHSQHGGQPTGKFRERGKEHFKQHMHASGETAGGIAKSFFNLVAGTFLFWLLFKSAGSTKERRRVARQKQRYHILNFIFKRYKHQLFAGLPNEKCVPRER